MLNAKNGVDPIAETGESVMMVHSAHSLGLFALVWAALCILASALVTDTLLRDASTDRK